MPNYCEGTISPTTEKSRTLLLELVNTSLSNKTSIAEELLPLPEDLKNTTSPRRKLEIPVEDPILLKVLEELAPDNYAHFTYNSKEYRRSSKGATLKSKDRNTPFSMSSYLPEVFNECKYPKTRIEAIECSKDNPEGKYVSDEESNELIAKYGTDNWYDWRIQNYGTKWPEMDGEMCGDDYHFSTAWCPFSLEFVELIHKHIGDFTYEYFEPGVDFGGYYEAVDGNVCDNESASYIDALIDMDKTGNLEYEIQWRYDDAINDSDDGKVRVDDDMERIMDHLGITVKDLEEGI